MRFQYLKYLVLLNLFFLPCNLNAQPNSKDTLCYYIRSLPDSNLVYIKNQKEIPSKIYLSIKKFEGKKFKIMTPEIINFSDVDFKNKMYGLIYFTHYANFYYLMLKQGGFAPSYVLKIFIEENSKIIAVRNFYMTAPYYLNEFVHLKWGCEVYISK
ncbi:MAG: hypothetical protein ABIY35_08940 [Chitinophagaceae bacterium]